MWNGCIWYPRKPLWWFQLYTKVHSELTAGRFCQSNVNACWRHPATQTQFVTAWQQNVWWDEMIMMTFLQKGQMWHHNSLKNHDSSHHNAEGKGVCDQVGVETVLFECPEQCVYSVDVEYCMFMPTFHVTAAIWSFDLNFLHMVRAHIHAGDPAQLCDPGNVPALWGHQLPVRLVPHPAGQSASSAPSHLHSYVLLQYCIFF